MGPFELYSACVCASRGSVCVCEGVRVCEVD